MYVGPSEATAPLVIKLLVSLFFSLKILGFSFFLHSNYLISTLTKEFYSYAFWNKIITQKIFLSQSLWP